MIDKETPMPGRDRDDKPSDELFDTEFLPDADGDFLGELDRVLTSEDDEPGLGPRLDDVQEDLESLDLEVEPESEEQEEWRRPAPTSVRDLEPETDSARKAFDRLQDLREHRRPLPAAGGMSVGTPEGIPPVAAVVRSPAAEARSRTGSASVAAAKPAGIADLRPATEQGKGRTPATNRQPSTTAEPAPPRAETPLRPTAGPPATPGRRPGIPQLWLGVLGLLALLGIGIGAVGLWLQLDTDSHMARMETRLAQVSGAEQDALEAAKAERLRFLEGEIAALRAIQDEFGPRLVQRLAEENEGLRQDLARLENTLTGLQSNLETVQGKLSEIDKRPGGAQRQPRAAASTSAGSAGAAPAKGGWAVNLMSFRRQSVAEKEATRLRDDGIPVTVQSAERKGSTWYRLRVDGFTDVAEAKAFAKKIRKRRDLSSAWVGRN